MCAPATCFVDLQDFLLQSTTMALELGPTMPLPKLERARELGLGPAHLPTQGHNPLRASHPWRTSESTAPN